MPQSDDDQLVLTFERKRETKNRVRYEPAEGELVVGSLYFEKDAAAKLGTPPQLAVRVAAAELSSAA